MRHPAKQPCPQIIPILKEAELAVKRLPEWMKDESCKRDAPMLLKGNSEVHAIQAHRFQLSTRISPQTRGSASSQRVLLW